MVYFLLTLTIMFCVLVGILLFLGGLLVIVEGHPGPAAAMILVGILLLAVGETAEKYRSDLYDAPPEPSRVVVTVR
jgi:hypothetical protein